MKPRPPKILTNVPIVASRQTDPVNSFRRIIIVAPIILCVLMCAIPASHASVVVVIRNGQKYWVGTDALESNGTGTYRRHICKVFNEGMFYWVATATPFSDPVTGFSLNSLVEKAKTGKTTIKEVALTFIDISKTPLTEELASIKGRNPTKYREFMSSQRAHLIKVFFFGVEDKHPIVGAVILDAWEVDGHIFVDGSAGGLSDSPRDIEFVATGSVSTKFLRERSARINIDPVGLLRDSIIAEENAAPANKGGRVAILEVTGSGVKWVDKGECH